VLPQLCLNTISVRTNSEFTLELWRSPPHRYAVGEGRGTLAPMLSRQHTIVSLPDHVTDGGLWWTYNTSQ
jgi:hypothetical protein